MEIREAVEADAEQMADIADSPPDVMRNLVHDRTVRVAVERGATGSDAASSNGEATASNGDATANGGEPEHAGGANDDADAADGDEPGSADGAAEETMVGLVSFDARDSTVHVTQLAGEADVCRRLLQEPIGFAEREGMTVELLVAETDDDVEQAVEAAGFAPTGTGPEFGGEQTTRYRLEPGKAEQ